MPDRIAYLPIDTYPEPVSDAAILATVSVAGSLGFALHVATFAVDVPPVASPLGGYIINIEGMARAAEERSLADCTRLKGLVEGAALPGAAVTVNSQTEGMGAVPDAAVTEARYFDLAFVPWSPKSLAAREMAQALVFGAGVPVMLVPEDARRETVSHIAVAWDESRAAARALGDALRLLPDGGRVSVLTVNDEKELGRSGISQTLAVSLRRRGYEAFAVDLTLEGRTVAAALQGAALARGAQLLVMGGFGHSRLRDFILGGATKGVLADLRMPVLLSH